MVVTGGGETSVDTGGHDAKPEAVDLYENATGRLWPARNESILDSRQVGGAKWHPPRAGRPGCVHVLRSPEKPEEVSADQKTLSETCRELTFLPASFWNLSGICCNFNITVFNKMANCLLYVVKKYPYIHMDILWQVFHILMELVPYRFLSVSRQNNEAQACITVLFYYYSVTTMIFAKWLNRSRCFLGRDGHGCTETTVVHMDTVGRIQLNDIKRRLS